MLKILGGDLPWRTKMRIPCTYLSLVVLIFLSLASRTQSYAQSNKQSVSEIKTKLDAYLRQASAFGFSGSALVAVDGNVILHRGYGLADRKRGISLAAESVYDIGSITKQFTASAIMKLEMLGKLDTDDLLSKHIAGVPPDKAGVTIHHLLTHTAGFPEYSGADYEVSERDETVVRILQTPLTNKPGAEMNYSNAGYTVLAAVIEKLSGQSYEAFLQEHLFKPAGMTRTGYVLPKFDRTALPHGYNDEIDEGTALDHKWSPAGPYWNLLGNGGILSTTGDMYKWYKALQGTQVLSAEAKSRLFTPFLNNYAYGWDVTKGEHGTVIGHNGGGDKGFNANFHWYPEKNVVVVVMSNAGDFYGTDIYSDLIMNKLTRLIFGEEFSGQKYGSFAKLGAVALKKYVGTYTLPSGARFIVSVRGQQLSVEPVGQEAVEMTTASAAGSASQRRLATDQTQTIVNGVVKREFSALKSNVPSDRAFERYRAIFEQRLTNWEKNDGAYESFEVLGTAAVWWGGDPMPATFVKLNFKNRAHIFRFHWTEGKIVGLGGEGISSPAIVPLQPVSAHTFVGWHLVLSKNIKVQFTLKENRVTALTITGNGESLTALKKD